MRVINGESGWYFHGMPYEMTPPSTRLELKQVGREQDAIIVAVTGHDYARVVTFHGPVVAEDNYFELPAGESRVIRLRAQPGERVNRIAVSAWNAPRTSIEIS